MADFLAFRSPSCVYASPRRAAQETAAVIAERLGLALCAIPGLRATLAVETIAERHAGEHVVCVAEAEAIARLVLGRPGAVDAPPPQEAGFCSVWTITVVGGHSRLRYLGYGEIAARMEQRRAG